MAKRKRKKIEKITCEIEMDTHMSSSGYAPVVHVSEVHGDQEFEPDNENGHMYGLPLYSLGIEHGTGRRFKVTVEELPWSTKRRPRKNPWRKKDAPV